MLVLEPLRSGSSSAPMCAQLSAAWHKLQSDLLLVAACAGLGGDWERLYCEPDWELQCKLRLVATCAG